MVFELQDKKVESRESCKEDLTEARRRQDCTPPQECTARQRRQQWIRLIRMRYQSTQRKVEEIPLQELSPDCMRFVFELREHDLNLEMTKAQLKYRKKKLSKKKKPACVPSTIGEVDEDAKESLH